MTAALDVTASKEESLCRAGPAIHLWIFNHPFKGVSEQVDFFCSSLRDQGLAVTVSRYPRRDALNVVIENFSIEATDRILAFCEESRKRVAVILTEHLDFRGSTLFFHGQPITKVNDYMDPGNKISRMTNLLVLRDRISLLLRLGDLPKLEKFENVVPGVPVRSIPYPFTSPANRELKGFKAEYDFAFTGVLTKYRRQTLARLQKSYRVYVPHGYGVQNLVSRRMRDAINCQAKLVLNIPQTADWQWVSPMRVLAALRCQRLTATFKPREETLIDCASVFTTFTGSNLSHEVEQALEDPKEIYFRKLDAYNSMVRSDRNPAFPHGDFSLWGHLEL